MRWSLVLLSLLATPAVSLATEDNRLVLDGIIFEAAHGGLRLVDGWGSGSRSDPFVVVEEIVDDGPAILTVRNVETRFGDRRFLGNGVGFALRKVVTNRTRRPWLVFEMELREWLEIPSGYFDGLSFGQARERTADLRSDRYPSIEVHDEPTDHIVYSGAVVEPGETVVVEATITDHSPGSRFFLIQRRDAPMALLRGR